MILQVGAPIIRIDFYQHVARILYRYPSRTADFYFYWKIHSLSIESHATRKKTIRCAHFETIVYPSHMKKLGREQLVKRYYKVEDIEEEPEGYRRNSRSFHDAIGRYFRVRMNETDATYQSGV